MKGRRAIPIELTIDEKAWLEKLVRTHTALQRDVVRAKIVLHAAQGRIHVEIARQLGIQEKTVQKWRKSFLKDRLRGLQDKPRSGAPSAFSLSGETSVH